MPGFQIYLSWNIRKVPLCQSSEYTFPEIQKISVMPGVWSTFPEIKEKLGFLKIRKVGFSWENIGNTFTAGFFRKKLRNLIKENFLDLGRKV